MKRMKKHLSMMLVLVFLFTSIISPLENAHADQGYGGGEAASKVVQAPAEQNAADVEQISQLPAAGNADLPMAGAAEKVTNGEALVKNVAVAVDTGVEEAGALTKTGESSDASEAVVDENAPIVKEDTPAVVTPEQQESQAPEAVYTEPAAEQTVTEAVYSDLSVPQNVSATATDTSISVKWDAVDGAASYDVEVDGRTENVEATEYVYSNLTPNTEHSFRLRAVNGSSTSSWTDYVKKYTMLATPTGLKSELSGATATITWNAVVGATGYDVYRDGIKIGTVVEASYTDKALEVGKIYIYSVKAYNDVGNISAESSGLTVMIEAVAKAMALTSLSAVIISSNMKLNEDTAYGDLTLTGGTLDLNGHTLTVEGNLLQTGGTMYVHGGLLDIAGDYNITGSDGNNYSTGCLKMVNTEDRVIVNGNFVMNSSNNHDSYLTAGVLEIKGDFTQKTNASTLCNFSASGTHKVLLSGSKLQTVKFEEYKYNKFNKLQISNDAFGVKFGTPISLNTLSNSYDKFESPLAIYSVSTPLSEDIIINGDVKILGLGLDLNGKTLKVTGNLLHTSGTIYVHGGLLDIAGDYNITGSDGNSYSTGCLKMVNTEDRVIVNGNFVMNSSNNHDSYLTAGVLEIKGDFTQKTNASTLCNFSASGTHKVLLSGSKLQTVKFEEYKYNKFNILAITKPLDTGYSFNKQPVWKTLMEMKDDTEAPTTPTNLAVTAKTNSSVSLSWTRSTDNFVVEKYVILRNGVEVGETVGTSYTDKRLSLNTTYTYRVKAVDANDNTSGLSNGVSVTTDDSNGTVNLGYGQDGEEYLEDLADELGVEVQNGNSVTYDGKTFTCNETNSRIVDGKVLVNSFDFATCFNSEEDINQRLIALDPEIIACATVGDKNEKSLSASNLKTLTETSSVIQVATPGERSENVRNIQKVLQKISSWVNKDGTPSNAKATGLYGEITQASLIKFQQDYAEELNGRPIFTSGCNMDMAQLLSELYIFYFGPKGADDANALAAKDYLTKLGYGNEFKLKNRNGEFEAKWDYQTNDAIKRFIYDYGHEYEYYKRINADRPTLYMWLRNAANEGIYNTDGVRYVDMINTKRLMEQIFNQYPDYEVDLKNASGSYEPSFDDNTVKLFLTMYRERKLNNSSIFLDSTYNELPDSFKLKAFMFWVNEIWKGNKPGLAIYNLLPDEYYENIPEVPIYDSSLGLITRENKYISTTAKQYYLKYYFPAEVVCDPTYISFPDVSKEQCYNLWARFTYGSSQSEQNVEYKVGIVEGLIFSAPRATYDTVEGICEVIKDPEQLQLALTFIAKATIDEEYREAFVTMVNQSVAEWQSVYTGSDPNQKGYMIGNLTGQTILIGLGGAASIDELKDLIKSGRYLNIFKSVTAAISKLKTSADDFLSYVSGKVVKLRDGLGFKPVLSGAEGSEEFLTIIDNSEISNMFKIESIAGAAGRYLSIDEVAPDIAANVKKVRFRGTVLDMSDESGNVLRRIVVPEGYRSTQQLIHKAFTGEVDVTQWGYTSAEKMEEVVNNINIYLNRTDLGSTPTLRNSKYAGQVYNGVEFDLLGFPIFKGNQLKADLSIVDDAVVQQKGLTNMLSTEHQQAATRQFKQLMQQEANSSGQSLESLLKSKAFDDTQISDIINEESKIRGYTWHHHQEVGRMQLVDEITHSSARHNGGDSLWGSGVGDE